MISSKLRKEFFTEDGTRIAAGQVWENEYEEKRCVLGICREKVFYTYGSVVCDAWSTESFVFNNRLTHDNPYPLNLCDLEEGKEYESKEGTIFWIDEIDGKLVYKNSYCGNHTELKDYISGAFHYSFSEVRKPKTIEIQQGEIKKIAKKVFDKMSSCKRCDHYENASTCNGCNYDRFETFMDVSGIEKEISELESKSES